MEAYSAREVVPIRSVMPDPDSAAWIERELTQVSAIHPAFDPAVWDLESQAQATAAQIDETTELVLRLDELAAEVGALRRLVTEQTDTITRILRAWTEE